MDEWIDEHQFVQLTLVSIFTLGRTRITFRALSHSSGRSSNSLPKSFYHHHRSSQKDEIIIKKTDKEKSSNVGNPENRSLTECTRGRKESSHSDKRKKERKKKERKKERKRKKEQHTVISSSVACWNLPKLPNLR